MTADLHFHTIFSDGTLTPETVVEEAAAAGLGLIAVTDHDTTRAYSEVKNRAEKLGVKIVTGIEVSAYDGAVKFHTLGYGMDLDKFAPFEAELFGGALKRAEDIVYKLNGLGFKISVEDAIAERLSPYAPLHAMHVAKALVKKGYIKSPEVFFKNYVSEGKPAFSRVGRPSPEEACEAITAAGGIAVLAHPGRITVGKADLKEKVLKLKEHGLYGIEVYYTTHTKEQTAYYKRLAGSQGLIATGGSDTHAPGGSRKIGQPRFEPCKELLKRLKVD